MSNIKFSADINETGFPFITVTEGTFKGLCFLLDTGSENNILFKSAYKCVKKGMTLTNKQSTLMGIEGKENIVSIARANISFCGIEHHTSFLLVDAPDTVKGMFDKKGLTMAGIIGIDFMLAHRWVIDIAAQEVIIRPQLILDCA